MPDATIPTMKYYAAITPPGRAPRTVAISLPLVPQIADEAHYRPPAPRKFEHPGERREPPLRKLVDRAIGRGPRSRAWGKAADAVGFQHVMKRIEKTGR
jgi:hypothetical protein